uniref:Histone domain-containing protein n=2 Tax=Caenorhabditis japonica TaxID=281687 RepID=A0A8R1IH89_CAEJA
MTQMIGGVGHVERQTIWHGEMSTRAIGCNGFDENGAHRAVVRQIVILEWVRIGDELCECPLTWHRVAVKSPRIRFRYGPRRNSSPPVTEIVAIPMGMTDSLDEKCEACEESDGDDVNVKNLRQTQQSSSVSIAKPVFQRLVAEIADEKRFSAKAMGLLHLESEKMLVEMFEAANEMTRAVGREKVTVEDVRRVTRKKYKQIEFDSK